MSQSALASARAVGWGVRPRQTLVAGECGAALRALAKLFRAGPGRVRRCPARRHRTRATRALRTRATSRFSTGRGRSRTRLRRRTPPAAEASPAQRAAAARNPPPNRRRRPRPAPARGGRRGHRNRHFRRGRRHASRNRRAKKSLVRGRRTSFRRALSSRARSLSRAACVRHWRTQNGASGHPASGTATAIEHPRRMETKRRTRRWRPSLP
jgi:hypothetical protein